MKKSISKPSVFLGIIVALAFILRLPWLGKYPPALYSDEVAQGYNAYSILKTGKDEHGEFLPVSIRSFGDWKPPLQTYLMIPSIAVFGLNSWGVRLPSAILGSATILITYYLVIELLSAVPSTTIKKHKSWKMYSQQIALFSALFLSISPWHIHQSRAAMLVTIAHFFFTLAMLSFLRGLKKSKWFYLSTLSFTAAVYSYYGMRLIVPVFIVVLLFWFRKSLRIDWSDIGKNLFLFLALLSPLLIVFIREPNVIIGRAKTVSIFYDQHVPLTVWNLIAQDGSTFPTKLAQFFHNKPHQYTLEIIRRFFQHFDGRFLFLTGDQHLPFQIPSMGVLYIIDALFIGLGIYYLVRKNHSLFKFISIWVAISVLPASLTFMTPSANRTFTMVTPLLIVVSIGVVGLYRHFHKILIGVLVFMLYFGCLSYFSFQYFRVLPEKHADWWLYGYKELIYYLSKYEDKFDTIAISGKASMPYIYHLFYTQADPADISDQIVRNFSVDEYGFEHVSAYDKYRFIRDFTWVKDGERLSVGTVLVTTASEEVGKNTQQIYQIKLPDDRIAFNIYQIL